MPKELAKQYAPQGTEDRIYQNWCDKGYFHTQIDRSKKPFTIVMPPPNVTGQLHMGHAMDCTLQDILTRFKRMQGYEVFQPMGFDAFGLPAENYAIKTGIHPEETTLKNIATMEGQLKRIGAMYDWDYEIKTCLPAY